MRGRSSQKSGDSDMKETIEEIKESTKPQWTAKEVDKKTGCFYVLLLHSLRSEHCARYCSKENGDYSH